VADLPTNWPECEKVRLIRTGTPSTSQQSGIFIARFIGLRTVSSYNRRLLSFTREPEMQFNLLRPALLLVAGLLATNSVFAEADAEKGATKAYTCTGCHGIPGYNNIYPTYKVPKLGGQNFEYLVAALHAYRDGERKHSTMELQAAALSDQDILDISAYFVEIAKEQ
jgi:cytochrome c553